MADGKQQQVDRAARVYIAGHRGLAGSAIWRAMKRDGFKDIIGASSTEVDLRERSIAEAFLERARPQIVVLAAAKVGGILANSERPVDFLSDNLRIQVNVMNAANDIGVERLIFLGSSCIYPRLAEQPIEEGSLLTGPLEPTNDAYAIAKIAGVLLVQAMRRQYGRRWVSVMPTNLYGPGDNFSERHSHVLPALIRRFHDAKMSSAPSVALWGTGTPRREFLHTDDLGSAIVSILDKYDSPEPINVGVGSDVSIRELAEIIANVVGYEGDLVQDVSKPDGTPSKLLNSRKLDTLGWSPTVPLRKGIQDTYQWFLDNHAEARL